MKWERDALWLKARRYADRAHDAAAGDADFPFYSSLSLEFLAKAALANVHPALLAKPDDDGVSLLHALGFETRAQPQTVEMKTVYLRLMTAVPAFTKPHMEACGQLTFHRNEELHTGAMPFEPLKESAWLPGYYGASKVLCESLGKTLADYVGLEHAEKAEELLVETDKNRVASVNSKIASFAKVFAAKGDRERAALSEGAEKMILSLDLALGARGVVRQSCPACKASARVMGDLINASSPFYDGSDLVVRRTYLASELKCVACGLTLSSIDEVRIGGIEPRFHTHGTLDPRDYFQFEEEDPYMNM